MDRKVYSFSNLTVRNQERLEKRRHIVGKQGEDGWKRSGNSCFTGYFSALVAGGKTTGYLSEKGRLTK